MTKKAANPYEIALDLDRMLTAVKKSKLGRNNPITAVAKLKKLDRFTVRRYLKVLTLDDRVQALVRDEKISLALATELASLSKEHQFQVANDYASGLLKYREAMAKISAIKRGDSVDFVASAPSPDTSRQLEHFAELLGFTYKEDPLFPDRLTITAYDLELPKKILVVMTDSEDFEVGISIDIPPASLLMQSGIIINLKLVRTGSAQNAHDAAVIFMGRIVSLNERLNRRKNGS